VRGSKKLRTVLKALAMDLLKEGFALVQKVGMALNDVIFENLKVTMEEFRGPQRKRSSDSDIDQDSNKRHDGGQGSSAAPSNMNNKAKSATPQSANVQSTSACELGVFRF